LSVSEIRDRSVHAATGPPGFAALKPGYRTNGWLQD